MQGGLQRPSGVLAIPKTEQCGGGLPSGSLLVVPLAGVQPQQDAGGTLRMNGVSERERRNMRLALIGPSLCTGFVPFHRTFSRYKMLTHDYTGLVFFFYL